MNTRHYAKRGRSIIAKVMTVILVLSMILPLVMNTQADAIVKSIKGFGYNVTYSNQANGYVGGWDPSNLGSMYDEGEWVPYQTVLHDIDWSQFDRLGVEYDFSIVGKDLIFFDLVRNISIADADEVTYLPDGVSSNLNFLPDEYGFPYGPGDTHPTDPGTGDRFVHIDTIDKLNDAQRDPNLLETSPGVFETKEYFFEEFKLVDFVTDGSYKTQINRALDGSEGTMFDEARMFYITRAQIEETLGITPEDFGTKEEYWAAGYPRDFAMYFQLHLSRTWIWNNIGTFRDENGTPVEAPLAYAYSLHEDNEYEVGSPYDWPVTSPTHYWGGYLYTRDFLQLNTMFGSGPNPGSSGHSRVLLIDTAGQEAGAKTIPIPNAPETVGMISGIKFEDLNANGIYDDGDVPLKDWEIFLRTDLYAIQDIEFSTFTDDNGYYEFNNLPYYLIWELTELQQSEYGQTYPNDATPDYPDPIVKSGDPELDFYKEPTELAVMLNYPELLGRGLWGWTIKLLQPDDLFYTDIDFGNAALMSRISITPDGTNEVDNPHTFTALLEHSHDVGTTWVPAGAGIDIDFALTGVGNPVSGQANPVATDSNGEAEFTIVSDVTGTTTVSASADYYVGNLNMIVETDGLGENSEPAVKKWVDARISITPDGYNEIGMAHEFTALVEVDDGSGWMPAVDGTIVYFNIDSGPGSLSSPSGATVAGEATVLLDSSVVGVSVVSASVDVTVEGEVLSRVTDGSAENSYPAEKTWLDARISITPDGYNEIGMAHEFTALVEVDDGSGWMPAVDGTIVYFNIDSGPGSLSSPSGATVAGEATVLLDSSVVGVSVVSASVDVTVEGEVLSRVTDGSAENSYPAEKTWLDARISITPDGYNEIGMAHEFTALVEVDDGSGWMPAVDGTIVYFNIDSGPGSLSSPSGATVAGEATVLLDSSVVGVSVVSASVDVTVEGEVLSRVTDGSAENSYPAEKTWLDARISITPDGYNEIGMAHEFTALVEVDDGSGWMPAVDGTIVYFNIDSGPGSLSSPSGATVAGEATVLLDSSVVGVSVVSASVDVTVEGEVLSRVTDGSAENSYPAEKTWLDARISITPDGYNEIGMAHEFTALVEVDDGSGWMPAVDGTIVYFNIDSGPGSLSSPSGATVAGEATVLLDSSVVGVSVVSASVDVTVEGEVLSRVTDGSAENSYPAEKTWLDARISITPDGYNEIGMAHEFTALVEVDDGSGWMPAVDGTIVYFNIDSGPGSLSSPSGATVAGEATVLLDSSVVGVSVVSASVDVTVEGEVLSRVTDGSAENSYPAEKTWLDARISITPDGYNEIGMAHEFTAFVEVDDGSGWMPAVDGTIVYFNIDSGPGSLSSPSGATVAGEATVLLDSSVVGVSVVSASVDVTVEGEVLSRVTDGSAENSYPAEKTWLDARISITPDGYNEIGMAHEFTAFVEVDDGSGWMPAVDGTIVYFNIDSGPGSLSSPSGATVAGEATVLLDSSVVGVSVVSASVDVTVEGEVLSRVTDGSAENSYPAEKTWLDARISITPDGYNEIGMAHEFTALVEVDDGSGWMPAVDGTIVYFNIDSGPGSLSSPSGATVAGEATVLLDSSVVGVSVVSASVDVTVEGEVLSRVTDGSAENSYPAEKTWLDARISITPDGYNEIGMAHEFTALVEVDDGSGWMPAVDGTIVYFNIDSGPGSLSSPSGATVAGEATVLLDSSVVGVSVVSASVDVTVEGEVLSRVTDGSAENSYPAEKTWLDARISITPDGYNEIGMAHEFTALVEVDDGSGWMPAVDGTIVYFNIDSGPGSLSSPSGATVAGEATVLLDSSVVGVSVVSASVDVTVEGEVLSRVTDGSAENSYPAEKTWLDARISITPDGYNEIGMAHEFTALVEVDDGSGWMPAVDGTIVYFNIDSGPGSLSSPSGATVAGEATVLLDSSVVGVSVVSASVDVTVEGEVLSRVTDGSAENSYPAEKTWLDARISITPDGYNEIGMAHEFTALVEVDDGSGWMPAVDGTIVYFNIDSGPGSLSSPSGATVAGEATVLLDSSVVGVSVVSASVDVTVEGEVLSRVTDGSAENSYPAEKTWLDARISITPDGYNEIGMAHEFTALVEVDDGSGWMPAVDGTIVYFNIDSGPGSLSSPSGATVAGEATVLLDSSVVGVSVVSASVDVTVEGEVLSRVTDGSAENSYPAEKTWVDAYILIGPPEDTNLVGDEHIFTATVMINDGFGWMPAVDGTIVDFNIDSGPGTLSSLTGATVAGEATVILNSNVAGTTTVSASVNVTVEGVALYRITDGTGNNSAPAIKHWVSPETACAAHVPGDYRFTEKGNWFTYVSYDRILTPLGEEDESTIPGTVNLYAGQNELVGTVVFTPVGTDEMQITINLLPNWSFAEGESIHIQDYAIAPIGEKAVPGQFDYHFEADSASIIVPLNNYYAVHCVVY